MKKMSTKKMVKAMKKYMKRPYSKGDFYGGLAVSAVLYGALLGGITIADRIDRMKRVKNATCSPTIEVTTDSDIDLDVIEEAINEDEA